jgi:two-component system, response regulator PdtaR
MPCNILIVVRKPELSEQIKAILTSRGYLISDACISGMQALRSASSRPVDIAIVGFTLSDMSGLEFAGDLLEKCDCSVLLLTPPEQMGYVKEQAGSMDIVTLPRPATAQAMLSTLELMQHYHTKLKKVSDEAHKLKVDLERRALAEKAKVVLMHRMGMTEAEAWRYLQKRAMDTGRTLRDISTQVLELYKNKE